MKTTARSRTHASLEAPRSEPAQVATLSWRVFLWPAIAGAIASTLLALLALQALDFDPHRPLAINFAGDAIFSLEVIKTVVEHGWYWSNPDVGAPFGQNLLDFPVYSGDTLSLILIKALGWLFDDPVLIGNAFYLLTYTLAGATATAVARRWIPSSAIAVTVGTLFAISPFHFARGTGHLFLSAYMTVPIGIHLALLILTGAQMMNRTVRGAGSRTSPGRIAWFVLLCVACGLGGLYYAVFSVILIGAAGAVSAVGRRSLRPLGGALACMFIMVSALGLTALPNVLHLREQGENPAVGQRQAFESELYGLKVGQLLVPIRNHRVDALAERREGYGESSPLGGEPGQELGLVAAVGFLGLIGMVLVTMIRSAPRTPRDLLLGSIATLVLTCVLVGTVSGFGAFFAETVSPQIRAWNRISIVIMFLSLLGVGVVAASVADRIQRRVKSPALASLLVATPLLWIGYLDQTNPTGIAKAREAVGREFTTTASFVDAIDERLPRGAMVFQLPYVPFPEHPPVGTMRDYDHFRPYVYPNDLRWSYGAIRGRDEDWSAELASTPPADLARLVGAAGFHGIYIDRNGYADRGASLESELSTTIGAPDIVSDDGRYSFFDLAETRRDLDATLNDAELTSLRETVLEPVEERLTGFGDPEQDDSGTWRWMAGTASIRLAEDVDPREYVLRGRVESGTGAPFELLIERPGQDGERLELRSGELVEIELALSGDEAVRLTTNAARVEPDAGDDRELHLRWNEFELVPASLYGAD